MYFVLCSFLSMYYIQFMYIVFYCTCTVHFCIIIIIVCTLMPYSCQLVQVPNRWHSSVGVSSSSPRTNPSYCTVVSLPILVTLFPAWRRQKGHSRREIDWYVHKHIIKFIIDMYCTCTCTCSLNISLLCTCRFNRFC